MSTPSDHKLLAETLLGVLRKAAPQLFDEDNHLDRAHLFTLLDDREIVRTAKQGGDENINTAEAIFKALLKNPPCKQRFFVEVGGATVFKAKDFRFFLEENKVDNSFTVYKNRIGLTAQDKFIENSPDVVLSWPYKDCVLAGGQSTDEGTDTYYECNKDDEYEAKKSPRKEIFFNETLAHDEINRLTNKKALVNWKRHTQAGAEEVGEINRDEGGTIRENLIIKGNNLLALHALKQQFEGKVKLIYIDPPYNTGGDGNIFTYNNTFNHSTWMTFMKNRLEIAHGLLRNDGFIVIAIDHSELFYLGVLADEIFGRESRLGIVSIAHKPGGVQFAKFFSTSNDYAIVYAKEKKVAFFNKPALDESVKKTFEEFSDDKGGYKEEKFMRDFDPDATKAKKPKYWYPIYVSKDLLNLSLNKKEGYSEVFPISSTNREVTWNQKKETFLKNYQGGEVFAKYNDGNLNILRKVRENQPVKTLWTEKKYDATSHGTKLLTKIFGNRSDFSYPKSLYTVLDTLQIMTNHDDIILDFFAGSGTTAHAVLALNKEDGGSRQFILVEQLAEHIAVCQERITKVIQHSGCQVDFIYCELAQCNEKAKQQIAACKDLPALEKLFAKMDEEYFLHYNLRVAEFREKICREEKFRNLPLDKIKEIFAAMLDLNQLYVPRSEMSDKRFGISKNDQKYTIDFYGQGE